MPSKSKYIQIKQSRVPTRKRSRKVFGSGEDDGKWFRCWNCGFINNIDRNAVGDGSGLSYQYTQDGVTYPVKDVEYQLPRDIVDTLADGSFFADGSMDASGSHLQSVTMGGSKIGSTGKMTIQSEYITVEPVANSGCSFCGCKNYR